MVETLEIWFYRLGFGIAYLRRGYIITDDEDDFSQEIIEPIQTSGQNSEAHALLLQLLKEKDNEIGNLREEIGRLKAENAEIKRHAERLAGLANTDSTAHVG